MLPAPPFVPLVEVCLALREPYGKIHAAVVRGAIPAERKGTRWFVRREVMEELKRGAGNAHAGAPVAVSA